jgi:hypothetical protein
MSMLSSAIQRSTLGLHTLEQYEPLIGAAAIDRYVRHLSHRESEPSFQRYGNDTYGLIFFRAGFVLVRPLMPSRAGINYHVN